MANIKESRNPVLIIHIPHQYATKDVIRIMDHTAKEAGYGLYSENILENWVMRREYRKNTNK